MQANKDRACQAPFVIGPGVKFDIVRPMRTLCCLMLLFFMIGARADATFVAVASNLTQAVDEINTAFYLDKGMKIELTFGSSGNFARQIIQGAPFKVFISADKKYIDFIERHGVHPGVVKEWALGRIGLYIPDESQIPPTTLAGVLRHLQYGDFRKMVIANPEHAPYGLAAAQALKSAGLWAIGQNKLLLGENAAQAMQFCTSGNVDLCIIPTSFLALDPFLNNGNSYVIPEAWHRPVRHYVALLAHADPASAEFLDYLLSRPANMILTKYGYRLPETWTGRP